MLSRSLRFPLNTYQFNFKNERGVRRDNAASAAFAVAQTRRNENLPLGTRGHELQDFLETGNDFIHLKGHRLPGFFGAIELGPVNECPLVIAQDRVGLREL